MILVDTSIWIFHLREGSAKLSSLLGEGDVCIHPFIIGELACGNMKNRKEVIPLLHSLPIVKTAEDTEILEFIEIQNLMGLGLGLIDIHLLASTYLSKVLIWSKDKKLHEVAKKLHVCYT